MPWTGSTRCTCRAITWSKMRLPRPPTAIWTRSHDCSLPSPRRTTSGRDSSATPNRRPTTSAITARSAAPDLVVVGVRRRRLVHGLVVEAGHLDAVGAGQLQDLGGPGDPGQVRPVANLAAIAFELSEKLFRPSDFVLRRRQPLVDDGTLVRGQTDFAGHAVLHRHRG